MTQFDKGELLRIHHTTRYHYAFPVTFEPHRIVLRPREGHDLRVERHELSISPEARSVWSRDIFGNSILQAHFPAIQATELVIESNALVRRYPGFENVEGAPHASCPPPIDYDPLEHNIITGYLTPVFPEETLELRGWTSSLPQVADFPTPEAFVLELTSLINKAIEYRRREDKGVQTPASTLSLRSGSCRDMATLMMEALRQVGLAARFVSGYLDCPATRAARGSTHAWTECYFPHLGWRGFDPTTGKICDHHHIAIATSHHPRGVMPISGRFFGATNAFKGMSVTVTLQSE